MQAISRPASTATRAAPTFSRLLVAGLVSLSAMLAPVARAAPVNDAGAVLDRFHLAASKAQFNDYFALFTPDAVFIGTDASERWTVEQFKAYAKQYGVLFASIKDKSAPSEKIDIMFKAEDVSKLNRIYEQLGYTVPKKIATDRKNAETRRQTPDPMLTRGKTMEDIDPRPSFKTVAAQLRKAAARSAERAFNATRKEER